MKLANQVIDNRKVIVVEGRIDGNTIHEFEEYIDTVIDESDQAVVLDCSSLIYINSSGLRRILIEAKALWTSQKELTLCCLQPQVYETFKIVGFDKIMPIKDSLEFD